MGAMKIEIARKAGFCMGVRRAVKLVLKALNEGKTPLYTYGPLIHNPQTLELLEKLGVRALKGIDEEVPKGTCIIRAHGVPPTERETLEQRHSIIDGTCPRVLKVQALAKRAVDQGKEVIIIGDRDHAEVRGILGYCKGRGYVVSSFEDIERLPELKNYVILSQTTQDEEIFQALSEEILRRYPGGEVINTICNATEVRQSEVRRLCQTCEAIVVIGGKFSANTARLASIAKNEGRKVYLIEKAEELPLKELKQFSKIGITAGASTPNWLINEVVDYIKRASQPTYLLLKAFHLLSFHEALAFLLLVLSFIFLAKEIPQEAIFALSSFVFSFVLFRKNLINYLQKDTFKTYYPLKEKTFERRANLLKGLILTSFAATVIAGFLFKPRILSLVLAISLLDIFLYKTPLFFLNDLLLLGGVLFYLYPFWTDYMLLLSPLGFSLLFWLHLYKELTYLQSDGFLPKNFLIMTISLEERNWFKLLLALIALVGVYIVIISLITKNMPLLLYLLLVPVLALLVYILRLRPLGQILYLESLYLPPFVLFLLLTLILKYLT